MTISKMYGTAVKFYYWLNQAYDSLSSHVLIKNGILNKVTFLYSKFRCNCIF